MEKQAKQISNSILNVQGNGDLSVSSIFEFKFQKEESGDHQPRVPKQQPKTHCETNGRNDKSTYLPRNRIK